MRCLTLFLLLAACALSVVACDKGSDQKGGSSSSSTAPSGTQLRIAVIPKGTTHVYWKSVQAGAERAAAELGVEMIWKGPLKENDRAQQIGIVEQFISDKVSAIVLAPLDDNALVKPVTEATEAKIPVIIIDSGLKAQVGRDFASFVSTDNYKGGQIAGEKLVKLLNGKGKVVLLRYMVGSASTAERESGFLDVLHKTPGIEVLVDNRYGGATASESQAAAFDLIDQIKNADGIFCPNESSTFGMLQALKKAELNKKKIFVGFDATPDLVAALRDGDIQALVAQDPIKMGYEGVKQAVAAAKGEPVQQRVDTGVRLITPDELNDPAVLKMIGQ